MNRRLLMAALVVVVSVSMVAQAKDEIGYSYVDISYEDVSIDDGPDGDGYRVGFSIAVQPKVHVFGDYEDISFDPIFGLDADGTEWDVGLGWNGGFGDSADFVADVFYLDVEVDVAGFGSVSDDGFGVRAGVRGMVASSLELAGFVEYTDLSDSGDETSYAGEIRWNTSDIFTIGAGYSTADDADTIYGGVRLPCLPSPDENHVEGSPHDATTKVD